MPALLYALNLVYAAIAAGAFAFHALIMGAFLNWLLHHGQQEALRAVFVPFRERHTISRRLFPIIVAGQLLLGSLSLIANLTTHATGPQMAAILALPIAYAGLHYGTGFAKVEDQVLAGRELTPVALAKYLGFDRPLHVVYAVVSALVALVLALN